MIGIFLNNSVKAAGWQLLGVFDHSTDRSGVRSFVSSYQWFTRLLIAVIAIPPVTLMILGGRHIAARWSNFELNRDAELALAMLAAIVVISFFVLVPALIRQITNLFRGKGDGTQ